ncbi:hypothetical protein [Xanthocytophaga agilis]|uniref:DUF4369 domain-containing protein n=1 Tax=Xanthocytophaga agilis TaxID=3048010 RepID=A0AAE3R3W3_9BACT|nr:hypothetical protein [Xanthocytophaga agilis]MDJ1501117.1 hypothetical protein [Xanthocytophaga agilis]
MRLSIQLSICFLAISCWVQARSVKPIPFTVKIHSAHKISICRFLKRTGESSQFYIVKMAKGKANADSIVVLPDYEYIDNNYTTDCYYAIGELENGNYVLSRFKMTNRDITLYEATVRKVECIYVEKDVASKRKQYLKLVFGLIRKDFLKSEVLYELSQEGRFLYEKASIQNPNNEVSEWRLMLTYTEKRKIFHIFLDLKPPSYYEWNLSQYFLGINDQKLKRHLYQLIDEWIIELEKDPYFICDTDALFRILEKIETNPGMLNVIDAYDKDIHAEYTKID